MVHHGKLTFPIGYNNDTEERGTRNADIFIDFPTYQRTSQNLYLNYIHYGTRRTAYVRTRCYYRCKEAKCSKEN